MIDGGGIEEIVASSFRRAPWGWGGFVLVIGALIKVWPILNEQVAKVKEARRGDRRNDIREWQDSMRQRLEKVEAEAATCRTQMEEAKDNAHRVEMKLMTVTSAFQLLVGELRKVDPTNPTLKQAVDLVGLAVTEDGGINRALTQLARVPGLGMEGATE